MSTHRIHLLTHTHTATYIYIILVSYVCRHCRELHTPSRICSQFLYYKYAHCTRRICVRGHDSAYRLIFATWLNVDFEKHKYYNNKNNIRLLVSDESMKYDKIHIVKLFVIRGPNTISYCIILGLFYILIKLICVHCLLYYSVAVLSSNYIMV